MSRSVYSAPEFMEKLLAKYRINQVKLSVVLTLPGNTPLRKALDLMREKKAGCVVTTNGDKLKGIFTERDLIHRVMGEKASLDNPIEKFMTENPKTLTENDLLKDALKMMKSENIRHLPIFDQKKNLKGVLSVRNVIKLFAEHFPAEVMNLPPKLHNHPRTPEGG